MGRLGTGSTYLHQADELRGLLNAGHKRGACAYRCEGAGNAIRAFKAFAPAVLAGIGELPPTLHDRSILVPLVPAEPGQLRARFDEHRTELEKTLARKLARWARDNFNALAACDPLLPASAFNRLADNWRPLFAVAQIVGGDWPQRAADAFAKLTPSLILSADNSQRSTLDPQLLLSDIREIFAHHAAQRLFSTTLIHFLRALPDRPWTVRAPSSSSIQNPDESIFQLTPARLGRRLGVLGIRSHTIRIGHLRAKGYDLADFAQAFARFPAAPQ